MKLFPPVKTRPLEAIKLSKTKQHQQPMRLVLQTKLSSFLEDRVRLPSLLLINHLVSQLRNKDSLLRLRETKATTRVQVVLRNQDQLDDRHQDQLEDRHQETKPRQAVQLLST